MKYFKEDNEHEAIENTVFRVYGGDVEVERESLNKDEGQAEHNREKVNIILPGDMEDISKLLKDPLIPCGIIRLVKIYLKELHKY